MNRIFSIVLLSYFSLLVVACESQNAQTNEQLDELSKQYFVDLQANNLDQVLDYYSDEFFNLHPKPVWRERLKKLLEKFGPIDVISLANKQADTRFSGKFFIYQYNTIHGKKRIKHILTWVLPVDGGKLKLVGHMIKEPRS